jgi:hypothetical protein
LVYRVGVYLVVGSGESARSGGAVLPMELPPAAAAVTAHRGSGVALHDCDHAIASVTAYCSCTLTVSVILAAMAATWAPHRLAVLGVPEGEVTAPPPGLRH